MQVQVTVLQYVHAGTLPQPRWHSKAVRVMLLDQLTSLAGLLLSSRIVIGAQIVRHGCIEISASTSADQLHEDSINSASEAEILRSGRT